MVLAELQPIADKLPRPSKPYSYGTAGFRYPSTELSFAVFAAGVLSALRSISQGSKTVGVMVTASHNPAQDNGVKIVDPNGDMLEASWEAYATALANAQDVVTVARSLGLATEGIAKVCVARDTRESGPELVGFLKEALSCFDAEVVDFGVMTTPQLHYVTRCLNDPDFGEPTKEGYNCKIAKAFRLLVPKPSMPRKITVDCANGVGAPALEKLVASLGQGYVDIEIVNGEVDVQEKLNKESGADYVKTRGRPPPGLDVPGVEYASLDGDADRIVFYFTSDGGEFHLLDGDKIASLVTSYLIKLVGGLPPLNFEGSRPHRLGMVQTAYANGASTNYVEKVLEVPVSVTKTGVKHLHQEACHNYDIGVYFEANGHGSVILNPALIKHLGSVNHPNAKTILLLNELINQTVGDALSDLFLVLCVLINNQDQSLSSWCHQYQDRPNKIAKVKVEDRSSFETMDVDRRLTRPSGMQDKIDSLLRKYPSGRSFVRPSGTEDVVRVYAEAATQEQVDELSLLVSRLVFDEGGGVGTRP